MKNLLGNVFLLMGSISILEIGMAEYGGEQNTHSNHLETPAFVINDGINDAWYNPETPGQGFFINVFSQGGTLFLAWFTYDTERPPSQVTASLGEPGHRWLTAFGEYSGNQALLDIEITSGGVFNAAVPSPSQQAYGSIKLEFQDCLSGMITFDIPSIGESGVIPIRRIANDNVALCEELGL